MDLGSLWSHTLAAVAGFVALGFLVMPFALLVAAGMLRQRRTQASSVTWLLAILLVPVIGIPLYWLFGNRKMSRIIHAKAPVVLKVIDDAAAGAPQPAAREAALHLGHEGLTHGNALRLHADGEEAFRDLVALIDGATRSIDIETFVLKSDATGKAILERLKARAAEGVKVRLLLDGLGSFYMPRRPLRQLRKAGGKAVFFLPIWRFTLLNRSNLRDHRKIAVFDGTRVFAGGRNLAAEYLGPDRSPARWADLSFVIEGPAVRHYAEIFEYDWAFATRTTFVPAPQAEVPPSRAGDAVMQVVPSGPDVADDELFQGILSFIFAAKTRLWIVTPYFIPSEMLAQALIIAVQRGIDLRIVVPEKSDQKLPDLARNQFLRDLAAEGAKPLLFKPGMLHAKALLVDDAAAAVGSANFDSRSMFLNFEVTSIVHSPDEVRAVEAWMTGLMAQAQPFADDASRRRDLAEGIARLLAPIL